MEENFYAVLGLEGGGPEVPHSVIRKAYRTRALLCHPDKRGDDPVAGMFSFGFFVLKVEDATCNSESNRVPMMS